MSTPTDAAEAEWEHRAAALEAAHQPLGLDLDDIYAEDSTTFDFTTDPAPLDGLDQIDRRLSTLRVAERRLADYDAVSAARLAELTLRIEQGRRRLVEKVGWLTRSLQVSHQAIIAEHPQRTRLDLPNGSLTSKAGGVEWVWPEPGTDDEAALCDWVRLNMPDAWVPPTVVEVPGRVGKNVVKAEAKDGAVHKVHKVTVPLHDDGAVVYGGTPVPGVKVKAKPREYTPLTAGIDERDAF